jgi:hypothetical protein
MKGHVLTTAVQKKLCDYDSKGGTKMDVARRINDHIVVVLSLEMDLRRMRVEVQPPTVSDRHFVTGTEAFWG